MNSYQQLWWQQARSDHSALVLLRQDGADPCHQLHYLQMVTEKLAKAYFLRSGDPPVRKHDVFVKFLRALGSIPQSKRQQVAEAFAFGRFDDFQNWIRTIVPLANELQNLAPALAGDGPNPEYPWPQGTPKYAPATFEFGIWSELTDTGRGRQLLQRIGNAVKNFPKYS